MDRRSALIGTFLGVVLLGVGVLADSTLVERRAAAERAAVEEAREMERLAAMTVRAALADLELDIVAGVPRDRANVERLAITPAALPFYGRIAPYSQRATEDIVELLDSEHVSAHGFPEAAVAALELERRGAPNVETRKAEVAERVLSGELPVHVRDLPALAKRLGITDNDRVDLLAASLEDAPSPERLARFPDFDRAYRGESVEGWSLRARKRIHYRARASDLLRASGVSERVRWAEASSESGAEVPGVAGLAVSVAPSPPGAIPLRWMRAALWSGIGFCALGVFAVFRAQRFEARAIAQEKRFLANVTHELRTPLAAIRVFGESLMRERGDPVAYGELIAKESERLEALVERALTATRVDEAPQLLNVEPYAIASASVSLLKERAAARSVCLDFERRAPELPDAFWDGDAVRRALINLLDNAIQHGGAGGHVSLTVEGTDGGIRFSVCDDGPGIRFQDRKRVFGRFERGQTDRPGTGLGLHVVERVARAHGGRVDLETVPGRGCRFHLTLPLAPPKRFGPDAHEAMP